MIHRTGQWSAALIGLAMLVAACGASSTTSTLLPVVSSESKLTSEDAAAGDVFDFSVAVSGNTLVGGATDDDDAGISSGSAYVFQRTGTGWSQEAKLTASDAVTHDWFGYSVAPSGNSIVVGAVWDDDGGSRSGATYVFQRSGTTWRQQAKLTAADAEAIDVFGISVAIIGDTVAAGAPFDDDDGTDSGSAHVCELDV